MSRDSDCGNRATGAQEAVFSRIQRICAHSLAVNAAQWMHFRSCAQQQSRVLGWMEAESPVNSLLLFVLPNLTLQAAAFLPARRQPAKVTYMLKLDAGTVVRGENFGEVVIYGDMPANLITFTAHTMRSIFAPLLTNSSWLRQMPPETAGDLSDRMQLVLGALRTVGGRSTSMPADDGCWLALRDAPANPQLLVGAVTELCISLERSVRRTSPKPALTSGFSEHCAAWHSHWNQLLALNGKLDELDVDTVGERLGAAKAPEYRQSLAAAVRMLRSELMSTCSVVAQLRALANQLRSIQTASGQEIAEAAAPTIRCCARMFRVDLGPGFARETWRLALGRSVCAEFAAEIRRQLGGVAAEVRVEDVSSFRLAEETVQQLRVGIRSEMGLTSDEASAIFEDLQRFAGRLAAIRRLLETALDWRTVGEMAIVAGGVAVFSSRLLQLAERFVELWKQFWMRSAGDLWTTDGGDFETRAAEFQAKVDGLRDSVRKAFPRALESCATVEHCQRMSDFIESLYSEELKGVFNSRWLVRQEQLVALERKEVDRLLLSAFPDLEGHLAYPFLSNKLLTIRALRLRLQSQERTSEIASLQLMEEELLQEFLIRFQQLERADGGDLLLNMLTITRLKLRGASALREDLQKRLL